VVFFLLCSCGGVVVAMEEGSDNVLELIVLLNAVRSLMSVLPVSSSVVAGGLTFFWSGDHEGLGAGVQAVNFFLLYVTRLVIGLAFAFRCGFKGGLISAMLETAREIFRGDRSWIGVDSG